MGKERINITVDGWVKEELDRRDDLNVSGAANDFFKQYLAGDNTDKVAKEMKIKRLKEKEEDAQEEAQQFRSQWQTLENELEEERVEESETWERALSMLRFTEYQSTNEVVIESPKEAVADFAEDLDMEEGKFRKQLKQRYKEQ